MASGIVRRWTSIVGSRRGKLVISLVSAGGGILLAVLAIRHFAASPWPFAGGQPALVVGAGALFVLAYAFKAYGWRKLFSAAERPQPLALAAANGGASVMGIALPGRFDEAIRIAIVRRYPGCPACVRTLCLSLFLVGLVDAAALAPLAFSAAVFPDSGAGVRAFLALVAFTGVGAAGVLILLPRLISSKRVLRFRIGRWLNPRTTTLRVASQAWGLVSASWLVRGVALLLLLGALGLGFSWSLALLLLCTSAAAAALPFGPAGAATQAGAGAAVLAASGVAASDAIGAALAGQALVILSGAAILLTAVLWRTGVRLAALRPVRLG